MVELKHDALVFSFPEVHPMATLTIEFQRTLRIPDDGSDYSLPPGLGRFPLRHVDDFATKVPHKWLEHGGVMMPMYQSEAVWLKFHSDYLPLCRTSYPFAIRIGTGKINAVNGRPWIGNGIESTDDHLVVPEQPWLDGYCIEKGIIRQFVAMPLGSGYSVEEQLTQTAEHGGLQIAVYPMSREAFDRSFPEQPEDVGLSDVLGSILCDIGGNVDACPRERSDMGLAPGGRMKQEVYPDQYPLSDWDQHRSSRVFVHLANSLVWRAIAGQNPPTTPPTAKEYTRAGLPWFEYYGDGPGIDGAKPFGGIKSVAEMAKQKSDVPLPENESVTPEQVVVLRKALKRGQVREGRF